MYPTFNSVGLQYWEWNKTLTTFRTGLVELEREIKFLGFRVWFEFAFKLETEIEFSLHFRVDKDYNTDERYWETPIFFLGVDPYELWEQIEHEVKPKDRGTWLSLAVGKWWLLNV
tara:strand:- start:375 stop:719 length:345 start_codon:yes stop_codon:yes gene_type:complete